MLRSDLEIYNRRHQLVLNVEIKKMLGVSKEWATQLRRNILEHGAYPSAPYFLIATPDRFFLWVEKDSPEPSVAPDYVENVADQLVPFFSEFATSPSEVSGFLFEQIVLRWLKSIMYPGFDDPAKAIPVWVSSSGLDQAILQGDFQFERVA